jgi:hypothetical protein
MPVASPIPSPNTTKRCRDKKSFRPKRNVNCRRWLRGPKEAVQKKCEKYYEGESVQHYWCRKTCSFRLLENGECFPKAKSVLVIRK